MKTPVVTFLDIETSPLRGWAWQAYDTNILRIDDHVKVISVAWKYLGTDKTYCRAICDQKGYRAGNIDDKEVVTSAWKVLDKTDILIGQNSDKFDIRQLNTRFAFHGLNAPSAYKSVDTLKVAKKYFRFSSNKLDNLGMYFDAGKKSTTGLDLWFRCMDGDKEAWTTMKAYNCNDVDLLEKVYLKLRPFIEGHPSLSVISGNKGFSCASCMSKNLQKRGFAFTLSGRKQRYQCLDCGSWTSGAYERHRLEEVV